MMIRKLLVLLCALAPHFVQAQTVQDGFVRPPDVSAYVEQFTGYAAGVTENRVGDGTATRGGTMPALTSQLADIPSTATGWILTGSPGYVTITNPAIEEAKFRTTANFSHVGFSDPVRLYGQPGASHCHTYFGNTSANAYSTFASLRNQANARAGRRKAASTVMGGPYIAGAYWAPCILKANPFGDGKNYVVPMVHVALYYVFDQALMAQHGRPPPRGVRMVFGTNMDDPNDTIVKAEIAAANAQPGTAGRYQYQTNGFRGWSCVLANGTTINNVIDGTTDYPGLKTAGGADPWGGNCVSGSTLVARLMSATCYDGHNLWAPGGYKHFRQQIKDNVTSQLWGGCPNGWYRLPRIVNNISYMTQGWTDYQNWYASSDASATAKAQSINPAAPAILPAGSMHADAFPEWDGTTLARVADFCWGMGGSGEHTCDPGTLDATHYVSPAAAPDGSRNPQVDENQVRNTSHRADLVQVPASLTGAHVMQMH